MIAAKESTVYALETEQRKLSLLLPILRFRKSGFFTFRVGDFGMNVTKETILIILSPKREKKEI